MQEEEEESAKEETTEAAVLSMPQTAEITVQPEDVTAAAGETVTFHVEAGGSDISYQWQWSKDGSTWTDCTSAGYNTDTFSFAMRERFAGRSYRCIVTADGEELISEAAGLDLPQTAEITVQPEDVTAAAGETVTFHVEASGSDISYQWQWSKDGSTWTDCASAGYNTDTFSFAMRRTFAGRSYRCIVTADGEELISEAGVVTLK